MANYKFETITDYDKFKIEVRKIENDNSAIEKETKCKSINKIEEKSELFELKSLLKKMDERVQALE